jgi:NAD(P)-dependent dehydrogenase (short-subunit alcohol dehydrogenase family)
LQIQGKICLVTGANAGIGKATALGLAEMGAAVVMVCRSRARGEAALADIRRRSGNDQIALLLADLSSQAQVRALAAEFKQRYDRLHVLVNNAAIIPLQRQETEDGLEMQFAVNHLAYFMLTLLLLDVIKASAPARIINVSSQVHAWGEIRFDDLQSRQAYNRHRAYAQAKLANVLFTCELARRLAGTAVTVNALHPGVIATKLGANYGGRERAQDAPLAEARRGAQTTLYLATSPDVAGVSGRYFVYEKAVHRSADAYDQALAQRLWQVSAQLTGMKNEADSI